MTTSTSISTATYLL